VAAAVLVHPLSSDRAESSLSPDLDGLNFTTALETFDHPNRVDACSSDLPPISSSLSRWERDVIAFQNSLKKSRINSSSDVLSGPSPIASRTRTSLKRSSSSSQNDEPLNQSDERDKTSVSLRKALGKRKSKDGSEPKRGKRDTE
jgi:hypothetical protein